MPPPQNTLYSVLENNNARLTASLLEVCRKRCILMTSKNQGAAMNYSELAKLLKLAGWYFERNGKGSHKIWRHPGRLYQIPVPDHGSKEIKPALVRAIKKQAGIE